MAVREDILKSIQLRPGMENVDFELLSDMIDDCILEIRDAINYGEEDPIPKALYGVIKELVCRMYNLDGTQGIQSESQSSGGSVSYLQDIPKNQKRQIYKHRRLRRG